MWMRASVVCLVASACGRVNFDEDDGLIVWLAMDDAAGRTTILDASGRDHHATCNTCPALGVSGVHGTAAHFDGSTEFAVVEYTSDFELDEMTISVWVMRDSVGPFYDQIVTRTFGTFADDIWVFGYEDPATAPLSRPQFAVSEVAVAFGSPGAAQLNRWVHLVGTYDGSIVRLYEDNVLVGTGSVTPPLRVDATRLVIGASDNNGIVNEHYMGSIDELRIYNRVLDDAEHARL